MDVILVVIKKKHNVAAEHPLCTTIAILLGRIKLGQQYCRFIVWLVCLWMNGTPLNVTGLRSNSAVSWFSCATKMTASPPSTRTRRRPAAFHCTLIPKNNRLSRAVDRAPADRLVCSLASFNWYEPIPLVDGCCCYFFLDHSRTQAHDWCVCVCARAYFLLLVHILLFSFQLSLDWGNMFIVIVNA